VELRETIFNLTLRSHTKNHVLCDVTLGSSRHFGAFKSLSVHGHAVQVQQTAIDTASHRGIADLRQHICEKLKSRVAVCSVMALMRSSMGAGVISTRQKSDVFTRTASLQPYWIWDWC